MRPFLGLGVLAGLLGPTPLYAADDLRAQAAAALKRYYAERLRRPFIITDDTPKVKTSPPPCVAPLKLLSAGKPQERQRAAAYLQALLAQALDDETSRTA